MALKKEELRIRNLVVLAHESNAPIATITEIRNNGVFATIGNDSFNGHYSYDLLLPIDLNEHWLERLGFEYRAEDVFFFPYVISVGNDSFIVSNGEQFWTEKIFNGNAISVGLGGGNKLHQLQNLFYYLSNGKELTIKEPINDH